MDYKLMLEATLRFSKLSTDDMIKSIVNCQKAVQCIRDDVVDYARSKGVACIVETKTYGRAKWIKDHGFRLDVDKFTMNTHRGLIWANVRKYIPQLTTILDAAIGDSGDYMSFRVALAAYHPYYSLLRHKDSTGIVYVANEDLWSLVHIVKTIEVNFIEKD